VKRLLALASALAVIAAFAIEPPKPATSPSPPAETEPAREPPTSPPAGDEAADGAEQSAEKPADAPEPETEEELPPLPADAAPAGPPPQRFNPTEKVRADFPVSFPIDI